MQQSPTQERGYPLTPRELEEFTGQLQLVCRACRKRDRYSVGRVFISVPALQKALRKEGTYEDAAYFTGYFHCTRCGSGGPWRFTKFTKARLTILPLLGKVGGLGQVHLGELRLYDGTPCHTGVEGETYLRRQIEADPDNYFLWNRLGNVFSSAEEPSLAQPAFEKAVALNPDDVESHHSLAEIYRERGELDQAAAHYHRVLRGARHAPPRTKEKAELLKALVRHTLESLCKLHQQTRGRIDFLPAPSPHELAVRAGNDREAVLVMKELDLSKASSWEDLTNSYLGQKPVKTGQAWPPSLAALPRREARTSSLTPMRAGRNDPCPCGSGKKFKKCCGR
jgi:tetratricopeptide (TPR) repeat protein